MPSLVSLLPEVRKAVSIIEDRLYFVPFSRPPPTVHLPPSHSLLCVDDVAVYQPFFSDFGPFHLGCAARFCSAVDALLAASPSEVLYAHCNNTREAKSNAAVLLGIYAVWRLHRSAADAYEPLRALEPYTSFRDASIGPHTFQLMPLDCISAFAVALRVGLFDADAFDVAEYEHFEQVEHGDLNVICPGRFIAFASPSPTPPPSSCPPSYRPFEASDYLPVFRHFNVRAVIRLNQSSYSPLPFTSHSIRHVDMPFPDGSNPPASIVRRFLAVVDEQEEGRGGGVVAVHCKAGLGRTGSLLGCWLMREYGMRANEAIAWLRLCRPGSVIGNQQEWLQSMEEQMVREGRSRRLRRVHPSDPTPAVQSHAKLTAAEERAEAEEEGPADAKTTEADRRDEGASSMAPAVSLSVGFDHQANGLLAMKALRIGKKGGEGGGRVGGGALAAPVHPMTTRKRSGLLVGDKRRATLPAPAAFRVQRSAAVAPVDSPHAATARGERKGAGDAGKQSRSTGRQQQARATLHADLKWRVP